MKVLGLEAMSDDEAAAVKFQFQQELIGHNAHSIDEARAA
jgi:hypothetical protein